MRYNKLTVFLGAISSLVLMTVVSALLGYGVTSLIPHIYTYYASVVIMFIFGFKMFWDAYKMKPNEAEELQNEAEADINRRERRGSERNPADPEGCPMDHLGEGNAENADQVQVQAPGNAVSRFFDSMKFWKKGPSFSQAPTEDTPRPRQPSRSPSPGKLKYGLIWEL
jgi:putative Ca2+/H+ antiporter (TMEM165/GDT1 family)